MVAINPATAFKSTTIEGCLLEIAQMLQLAEKSTPVEPGEDTPNRITLTISADTNEATIAVTIPLILGFTETGELKYRADEYTYPPVG